MLCLLVLGMAGPVSNLHAHDVPVRYFDRAIEMAVAPGEVRARYHLSLSLLTMAEELLSLVGAGGLSATSAEERLDLYAQHMGPLLARGLVLHVNGNAVDFEFISADHFMEDHPRFQFELRAVPGRSQHAAGRLRLEDTNFFLERGQLRIAIRAEPPCELEASNVPNQLVENASVSAWEMTPEQQDAARRAEVHWVVHTDAVVAAEETDPVLSRNEKVAAVESTSRSADLTSLLDRWSGGLSGILLGLAFFFGAAHAMTPGHGKTMVAAYLVGERGTLRHAISLGLTTSMTHTSSVLGVALLLWLAGPALQERISVGFSLLSGVLVAVLGACLLVARCRAQWRRGGSYTAATVNNERRAMEPESRMPGPSVVGLLTLGISGGIVPCWDAVVLLLIATAQGQVGSAVLLLVSFSAGLASALVFVGVFAVKLRGFLGSRMGSGRLVKFLPVLSAATIMAVGLYLCFTTLQQPMSLSSVSLPAARGTAGP